MGVLAVFAVLILAAFVAGSYYGIWTGILKPVRRIWQDASGPLRRRLLAGWIELGLFLSLFMAFLIVAPLGPNTFGYAIGGFGVALFVALYLITLQQIRQSRRGGQKRP